MRAETGARAVHYWAAPSTSNAVLPVVGPRIAADESAAKPPAYARCEAELRRICVLYYRVCLIRHPDRAGPARGEPRHFRRSSESDPRAAGPRAVRARPGHPSPASEIQTEIRGRDQPGGGAKRVS